VFKEPGEYDFDESSGIFNYEAKKYIKDGIYTDLPYLSRDWIHYWDDQKDKCRNGLIVNNKGKSWYLTRDYYMWLNFLPIFQKQKSKTDFPKIYDSQYHQALVETVAFYKKKHVITLKKRQWAASYFHMAKLINHLWFEEGITLKLLASSEDFINLKGDWAFLEGYRDFLNEHTA